MVLARTKLEECTDDKQFGGNSGAIAIPPTLGFLCETSMAGINDLIIRSIIIVTMCFSNGCTEQKMCIYVCVCVIVSPEESTLLQSFPTFDVMVGYTAMSIRHRLVVQLQPDLIFNQKVI